MASTYLQRTVGTPTNAQKYTYSFWIKRCELTDGVKEAFLLDAYADSSNRAKIAFQSTDQLEIWNTNGGSNTFALNPPRKFRDVSAFSHIVLSVDTTQSTDSDRVKLYVNGVQETSLGSTTYPSQNDANNTINESGTTFSIMAYGGNAGSTSYRLESLMTHIHFTDGYAYGASDFGETDSTSGIWKPKTAPSVTYGNNGFFLKMENSGAMGTDSSGNSNTFTVSGTLTQNVDTPSNNFATLNALDNYYAGATLSNGNLKSVTGTNTAQVLATMGVSTGKWYWEVKATNLPSTYGTIGICPTSPTATGNYISSRANEYMYYSAGNLYYNGGSTGTYASYTTGDIIGVAMDLDNNRLFFSKNGVFQNSADPTTSTGAYTITAPASTDSGFYFPAVGYWDTGNGTFECNFGQGYFGTTAVASANADANGHGAMEYAVPSGYYTLNTKNIKEFG